MSELSWWLQREYLWPPPPTTELPTEAPTEAPTEFPLDSPVSVPETELLPAVPAALAPASVPSGLLSVGQIAVILQGTPGVESA